MLHLGTLYEALLRLQNVLGCGWDTLNRFFQRIVDDPLYRRQIGAAFEGKLTVVPMTREDWVEREIATLRRLAGYGLRLPAETQLVAQVAAAWFDSCGPDHRFIPAGLTQDHLLLVAEAANLKLSGGSAKSAGYSEGEQLPTEVGTFEQNLIAMMVPTDSLHRPFNCDADEHSVWAKE